MRINHTTCCSGVSLAPVLLILKNVTEFYAVELALLRWKDFRDLLSKYRYLWFFYFELG